MNFPELTPSIIRKAIDQYLSLAWRDPAKLNARIGVSQIGGTGNLDEALAHFERSSALAAPVWERWTLRLGNEHYPFMKLALVRSRDSARFYFEVDSHDDLDVRPSSPDYSAWVELRTKNRRLADAIEREWNRTGIPTRGTTAPTMERLSTSRKSVTGVEIVLEFPDEATPEQIAKVTASVVTSADEIHRAHGGSGLTIEFLHAQFAAGAEVTT